LTKDPEIRYTPAGVAVTTFTLAVDRQFKNAQGEREADFIMIVCWRQLAELVSNYMSKGRMVAVEGRIQTRNYDNGEGRRVYVTEVVADNVNFLDKDPNREERSNNRDNWNNYGAQPSQTNNYGQQGNSYGNAQSGAQANAMSKKPNWSNAAPLNAAQTVDISDDDLPF
jgi:single-strand DNA-binding protein